MANHSSFTDAEYTQLYSNSPPPTNVHGLLTARQGALTLGFNFHFNIHFANFSPCSSVAVVNNTVRMGRQSVFISR